MFVDENGRTFKVMGPIQQKGRRHNGKYKVGYSFKGFKTWYISTHRQIDWRDTFDEAQADLNRLAARKGWTPNA